MKGFLAKLQLAGVVVLLPASLFVTPGTFFDGEFPLAVTAWLLWLVGIAAGRRALPASVAGRVAILGAFALAAIYGLSIIDSPDRPAAVGNFNLILAYIGWLLAAGSAFSDAAQARLSEPLVWLTATLAACWGLSERIAPGEVQFTHSKIAFGRLLEPIGYWNAMGALSGIGLVLMVALLADPRRGRWIKTSAAATAPLLMAALWLSFSRGALAATACGLAAVCVANGSWRAFRVTVGTAVLSIGVAVLCESLPGIRTVTGSLAHRETDGLILLLGLVTFSILAVAANWFEEAKWEADSNQVPKKLVHLGLAAAIILGLLPTAIVVTGSRDSGAPPAATGANASRLQSLESNRSRYWSVALDQFANAPVTGEGSGSFRAAWQRSPHGNMTALNAHSLEIEVLAELGLVGILSLALLFAGTWTSGTRRRSASRASMAGASAALAVWLAHSAIDWDWQVPGLMFGVIALAAAVTFAPRPGFDALEGPGLKAACGLVGLVAVVWTAHMWEAHTLRNEAHRMTETARVLGWTPKRESFVTGRLEEATWLNPDPLPRADLAAALFDMGRPKAAAAEALLLARENPDWWFGWALVWNYRSGTELWIAADARARSLKLRGAQVPLKKTSK